MNILAVIPARGNSKGIPQKNVRLINNKPLIYYAINNAKKCKYATDIVVSTDDDEIASIAKLYEAYTIMRVKSLAEDFVTLDPVIFDAVIRMEKEYNKKYDIVITLQATSPTLKTDTLNEAVEEFINKDIDTLISVVNNPHLSWTKNGDKFCPLYEQRANRQMLPPHYRETGAFLITKREFINENSRIGKFVNVYEVSDEESVDIDDKNDWLIAENILLRKRIILRVDGHKAIGMGHVYHCLTLAHNLTGHDILFVTRDDCIEGLIKLKNSNMPIVTIKDDNDFFAFLKKNNYDIVVNDCLDTTPDYIKMLKSLVKHVVTIEDMGEGTRFADVVINALYESETKQDNLYCGENYVCLRDEFMYSVPKPFEDEVKQILILFGGTDPLNLTEKAYALFSNMKQKYPHIHYTFITGIGYDYEKYNIITNKDMNITVFNDCKFISNIMRQADLALTSQGRTVYELASLGVPSIVMAQNKREELHAFAKMKNGFVNLGLGNSIDTKTLENTLDWLINTPKIREELRSNMLKHDLKRGIKREIGLILGD